MHWALTLQHLAETIQIVIAPSSLRQDNNFLLLSFSKPLQFPWGFALLDGISVGFLCQYETVAELSNCRVDKISRSIANIVPSSAQQASPPPLLRTWQAGVEL